MLSGAFTCKPVDLAILPGPCIMMQESIGPIKMISHLLSTGEVNEFYTLIAVYQKCRSSGTPKQQYKTYLNNKVLLSTESCSSAWNMFHRFGAAFFCETEGSTSNACRLQRMSTLRLLGLAESCNTIDKVSRHCSNYHGVIHAEATVLDYC